MVEQGEPQSIDEQASVYSWGDAPCAVKHLAGFQITNGLCWSPDSRTAYLADSPLGVYYAYDFDADSGSFSNRRIFATTPEDRKSTRLNSSHVAISYAVFCLKKKNKNYN